MGFNAARGYPGQEANRAPLPGLGREARRRAAPLVLATGAQAAARWTARVVTWT
jgi:hypothetical protein